MTEVIDAETVDQWAVQCTMPSGEVQVHGITSLRDFAERTAKSHERTHPEWRVQLVYREVHIVRTAGEWTVH